MSPKRFFKKTKGNTSDVRNKDRSPSISRSIPARLASESVAGWTDPAMLLKIYRGSLKVFIVLTFVLASVIVGFDLDTNIKTKQAIDSQREKLVIELKYWEGFILKNKDYRDAYFQASVLEYKLGNISKAKKYAEKGLSLDPNSENGRKIEELLNK